LKKSRVEPLPIFIERIISKVKGCKKKKRPNENECDSALILLKEVVTLRSILGMLNAKPSDGEHEMVFTRPYLLWSLFYPVGIVLAIIIEG